MGLRHFVTILCLLSLSAWASAQTTHAVHLSSGKRNTPAKAQAKSKKQKLELPVLEESLVAEEGSFAEALSERILPRDIDENASSSSVLGKIVDNTLAYWWDNSSLKNSSVGRAATQIEQKMKAEVNLGSEGTGEDKVDHKLSFKVLASQALAKIEYTGWFKAALNYDARSSKTEAEVFENLDNNKDLVISHSMRGKESQSQLSLRWNW